MLSLEVFDSSTLVGILENVSGHTSGNPSYHTAQSSTFSLFGAINHYHRPVPSEQPSLTQQG
jgi:hypothetical protein